MHDDKQFVSVYGISSFCSCLTCTCIRKMNDTYPQKNSNTKIGDDFFSGVGRGVIDGLPRGIDICWKQRHVRAIGIPWDISYA